MTVKRCPKCGETKILDLFYKNKSTPSGFATWCKKCSRGANRRWCESAAGKRSMYRGHLRKSYGLTVEQYDEMLESQKSVCAVCQKPESSTDKNGVVRHLAVDHDHTTGKVRGLLCQRCNTVLGLLGDSVALSEELGQYLIRSKS